MISDDEAQSLLKEFVYLRDKCKTSKSKKDILKYNKCTQICIEKFDYIVQNKVKKYKSFPNYDDLLQDGRLALVLALNSYDIDKGSWFWWANHYVKTKISREANKHSTIKIPLKKTKTITPHKISYMPVIADLSESALDSVQQQEESILIREAVNKLPSIHKKVIETYFQINTGARKNMSINYICNEFSLSKNECMQIINDAKVSLKRNLEDYW